MTPALQYLEASERLLNRVREQLPLIQQTADMFAKTILAGQMVHVFGSGHSRILVEEMWPRYGSFPGFNPIVELSLTFHNLVVGANGQRQAMFLENVSGFASRILRNFDLMPGDSALVISSGGCNVVPVEMAEEFQKRGVKVAAIISTRVSVMVLASLVPMLLPLHDPRILIVIEQAAVSPQFQCLSCVLHAPSPALLRLLKTKCRDWTVMYNRINIQSIPSARHPHNQIRNCTGVCQSSLMHTHFHGG
jgi:hypothetical protein